jgi:hypothetical protein
VKLRLRQLPILFSLCAISAVSLTGHLACALEEIPFPVKPATTFGAKTVDADFLKLEKLEVQNAEASLAGEKSEALAAWFQQKNQDLIQDMNQFAKESDSPGISREQAAQVLQLMQSHPVVGLRFAAKYDTWNQSIGYCFGRAAFTHWELLRRGVKPESIGKIFLIGDLKVDLNTGSFWNYHMATVVRDQAQSWWVIDPLVGEVMNVEQWMQAMKVWTFNPKSPRVRFYFSDANKMLPIPGVYTTEKLFFPAYKGYFRDLFIWFRKHPVSPKDRFDASENISPREGRLEDQIPKISNADELFVTLRDVTMHLSHLTVEMMMAPKLYSSFLFKTLTTTIS